MSLYKKLSEGIRQKLKLSDVAFFIKVILGISFLIFTVIFISVQSKKAVEKVYRQENKDEDEFEEAEKLWDELDIPVEEMQLDEFEETERLWEQSDAPVEGAQGHSSHNLNGFLEGDDNL